MQFTRSETAEYIASQSRQLAEMAAQAQMPVLAYLFEMAQEKARDHLLRGQVVKDAA